jgi:hypothetical protein
MRRILPIGLVSLSLVACLGEEPEGIAKAKPATTTVEMDFFHRPLPNLPLPNDLATRHDPDSPTGRRVNASMIAPTVLEQRVRKLIDQLDGWGVFQPISIPFSAPLDPASIMEAHPGDFDTTDDVVYLIDIDPGSTEYGKLQHLDVGNGNYPVVLERHDYWEHDPRNWTNSLFFEEADEDINGNGVLDPGEDTDADGVLDKPNYKPGHNPAREDLAGRADALMTFYEAETNTLIVRPMKPLRERTTYAVVISRRLKDANGDPVGSPYKWVNHTSQTEALKNLTSVLPDGLALDDIAFAFTFSTQTIESDFVAVREGLYGHGAQKHLGEDYPAELSAILPVRNPEVIAHAKNVHIMPTEDFATPLQLIGTQFFDVGTDSRTYKEIFDAQHYIDYHVVGSFKSPQLFERMDADGNPLPFDEQAWPADLASKPVEPRTEEVFFWLTVPRKEISARGEGKPAPIIILGHGYASNRMEALLFNGYLARHGFAVLAIDNVSHGLELTDAEANLANLVLEPYGVAPFFEAISKGRAFDHDNDGKVDSGADFWTAYLFHTRDVVRQSLLDYVQLIRIIKGWDGEKEWAFDLDGDGNNEIAGDFDADGKVDIGGDSTIGATGGSLGGIMSGLLGGVEPNVFAVAPIAGGGGLTDVGLRSIQGGVREAIVLRVMGPLFIGQPTEDGRTKVHTLVTTTNDDARLDVGFVDAVRVGDTVRVVNKDNGEIGCGYVSAEGTFRIAAASDVGDRVELSFYRGGALELGNTECGLAEGAEAYAVVDQFSIEGEFEGELITAGSPLVALAEGLGLRRNNPELRRFLNIGQVVLDGADPAVYARHFTDEPLVYPNMNEQTYTHAMLITTYGDMNVPAGTGATFGRAAGFIDYLNEDPRFGKTQNQMLLDTHTIEAVHTLGRFNSEIYGPVHMDIENFSQGTDLWGAEIPRLDPPAHLWSDKTIDGRERGGISGAIFPYPVPQGEHGFAFPGGLPDEAIKNCRRACPEGENCDCANVTTFDVGSFMFNQLGRWFRSNAREVPTDLCLSRNDCEWETDPPAFRPIEQLP